MKYYHGTTDIFPLEAGILKSPLDTGVLREEWRQKLLDKVFLTTSLVSAERYAKKAAERFGGKPVIYFVEPIGYFYNNCMNEYIADKAKIINKVEVAQKCHLFFTQLSNKVLTYSFG